MVEKILLNTIKILEQLAPSQANPSGSWGLFLLIFTFVYLALDYVSAFKGNKGAKVVVALIFGYFAARSSYAVEIVKKLVPQISVLLVAIVGFLFALAILAPSGFGYLSKYFVMIVLLVVFGVVVWSSLPQAEGGAPSVREVSGGYVIGGVFVSNDVISLGVLAIIFITLFSFIFGGGEKDEESKLEKLFDWLGKDL